jgi:3-hydroxymyristoyl/3-hydroxydecanoyl-(acyl carrier protein) dehydratase
MEHMRSIDSFKIPAQHPCLPGHFPGRPIVPGVVLLEFVEKIVKKYFSEWEITELNQVKFLQPVLPEELLELSVDSSRLESHHSTLFQLINIKNQSRVATGKLKLTVVNKG